MTNPHQLASTYRIHGADWESGRVNIDTPDHRTIRLTLAELAHAAQQPDHDLAGIYEILHRRAREAIDAARRKSIDQCDTHHVVRTEEWGFTGPVARPGEENPAAHGNICRVEFCYCGAERRSNINQQHIERGEWL